MPDLTSTQLATLATRLAQADCVGKPDWEAAAILNTPDAANGTKRDPISTNNLRRALTITDSAWTKMEAALAAAQPPSAAVQTAINDLLNIASLQDNVEVTPDASIISTHLTTLVGANIITAAAKNAVESLGVANKAWVDVAGFPVDTRSVGLARGGR